MLLRNKNKKSNTTKRKTHTFYKEELNNPLSSTRDWRKILKGSKKTLKWTTFTFLIVVAFYGCYQEFVIRTSPNLSQGVETYTSSDQVLPNMFTSMIDINNRNTNYQTYQTYQTTSPYSYSSSNAGNYAPLNNVYVYNSVVYGASGANPNNYESQIATQTSYAQNGEYLNGASGNGYKDNGHDWTTSANNYTSWVWIPLSAFEVDPATGQLYSQEGKTNPNETFLNSISFSFTTSLYDEAFDLGVLGMNEYGLINQLNTAYGLTGTLGPDGESPGYNGLPAGIYLPYVYNGSNDVGQILSADNTNGTQITNTDTNLTETLTSQAFVTNELAVQYENYENGVSGYTYANGVVQPAVMFFMNLESYILGSPISTNSSYIAPTPNYASTLPGVAPTAENNFGATPFINNNSYVYFDYQTILNQIDASSDLQNDMSNFSYTVNYNFANEPVSTIFVTSQRKGYPVVPLGPSEASQIGQLPITTVTKEIRPNNWDNDSSSNGDQSTNWQPGMDPNIANAGWVLLSPTGSIQELYNSQKYTSTLINTNGPQNPTKGLSIDTLYSGIGTNGGTQSSNKNVGYTLFSNNNVVDSSNDLANNYAEQEIKAANENPYSLYLAAQQLSANYGTGTNYLYSKTPNSPPPVNSTNNDPLNQKPLSTGTNQTTNENYWSLQGLINWASNPQNDYQARISGGITVSGVDNQNPTTIYFNNYVQFGGVSFLNEKKPNARQTPRGYISPTAQTGVVGLYSTTTGYGPTTNGQSGANTSGYISNGTNNQYQGTTTYNSAINQSITASGQTSNNDSRVAVSNWGQAWSMGPFYGLFVYPISWLTYQIQTAFPNPLGGWWIILGVFLIVFILRALASLATIKSSLKQNKMNDVQVEVAKINAKYARYDKKDKVMKRRKQAETMALYKKHEVSPFSSLSTMFITLPVFLAMWNIISSLPIYKVAQVGTLSLSVTPWYGMFHIHGMGVYLMLAITVGVVQIVSTKIPTWLSQKRMGITNVDDATRKAMKKQARTMNIMLGVFVIIGIVIPTLLTLYWIFSSFFTILQTYLLHRYHIYVSNKSKTKRKKA